MCSKCCLLVSIFLFLLSFYATSKMTDWIIIMNTNEVDEHKKVLKINLISNLLHWSELMER